MQTDYAAAYSRLYREHWWWRARERLVCETINKLCQGRRDLRILDVGCGDGLLFPLLGRFGEVEGIESDARIVTQASRPEGVIHIRQFDPTFQPNHRYDLILMLDVIEHVERDVEFLSCAEKLLKDDGRIICSVPAFQCLWTNHDVVNQHYRRYSRRSLVRLSDQANLSLVESRYIFHWLVFAKLLVRAYELFSLPGQSHAEIPPSTINRLLLTATIAEQKLFQHITLPFGSSLLGVMARRKV